MSDNGGRRGNADRGSGGGSLISGFGRSTRSMRVKNKKKPGKGSKLFPLKEKDQPSSVPSSLGLSRLRGGGGEESGESAKRGVPESSETDITYTSESDTGKGYSSQPSPSKSKSNRGRGRTKTFDGVRVNEEHHNHNNTTGGAQEETEEQEEEAEEEEEENKEREGEMLSLPLAFATKEEEGEYIRKQQVLDAAITLANEGGKLRKGIERLIEEGLLEDLPSEIAEFLHECKILKKTRLGDVLSDR